MPDVPFIDIVQIFKKQTGRKPVLKAYVSPGTENKKKPTNDSTPKPT